MKKTVLFIFFSLIYLPTFAQEKGIDQRIDEAFQPISEFFSKRVFFLIGDYPFVIYLLVGSAIFFTLYFVFPNIRYFLTSVNVVRGKYDEIEKDGDDSKNGEVSHFQALTTAVSGTVGNGNIAGVALAIAWRSRCNFLDDYMWINGNVFKICRMYTRRLLSRC